jgi:hypothetical protein
MIEIKLTSQDGEQWIFEAEKDGMKEGVSNSSPTYVLKKLLDYFYPEIEPPTK